MLVERKVTGQSYSRMPGATKRFMINMLANHENWHDKDKVRKGADEREVQQKKGREIKQKKQGLKENEWYLAALKLKDEEEHLRERKEF